MKKLTIAIITLLLGFVPVHSQPLSFTYAFLSRAPGQAIQSIAPKQESTPLTQADRLKIFLKPGADTYLYLFLHDAEGGLYLLFPERVSDLECCYTFNQAYTYPQGEEWAGFDATAGTEQFILLASCSRLTRLEQLTRIYLEKLALSRQDAKHRGREQALSEVRFTLLEQIRKMRLEHSDFTNIKEELTMIAGAFRGDETPGGIPCTRVTAKNLG